MQRRRRPQRRPALQPQGSSIYPLDLLKPKHQLFAPIHPLPRAKDLKRASPSHKTNTLKSHQLHLTCFHYVPDTNQN
uniref:Uncharacterized protein n=1 Tax=Setaria italica TaxID=4555 RepID=K3ZC20_SETIT